MSAQAPPEAAVEAVLAFADDELVLGWRDSEWTGIAPFLEEDVAFSSIAQGEIGHARALYELAAGVLGGDADALAFDREPPDYRCAPFVELQLVGDWAGTVARHWLYETADSIRVAAFVESDWPELAGLAAKMDREEAYHRMHAQMWCDKLSGGRALRGRRRRALALRARRARTGAARAPGRADRPRAGRCGRARLAHRRLRRSARGDDDGAPLGAGGNMVTAEEVWEALADIPDPEIPVISLVDLGVVREVEVEGERVRVEFTPTFLGCPAQEVMRDRMAEAVRALGAEPEIDVVLDDSWSTDRITPEGRRKLEESGFAPPHPRAAAGPTLVQLDAQAFRCPYCGSMDTGLENLFGPTPCRSIRYCRSCRQPFEQFKTI